MKEKIIPVIYNTNDDYVIHTFLSMYSLVANASREYSYEVYVLFTRLSEESRAFLSRIETDYCKVKYVNVSDWCKNSKLIDLDWDKCSFPMETTYRLFIPDILQNYEKALYVDGDTIVLGDVSELYSMELGENYLAACTEPLTRNALKHNNIIGISNPLASLNSGVLVFNCAQFRKNNVRQQCFSLLVNDPEKYIYLDQDALNVTCDGHILFLPWRWNISWAYTSVKGNRKNYLSDYLVEYDEKCDEALKNIGVIHYSTLVKAVDEESFYLANYFWEYAQKADVMEQALAEKKIRHERLVAKLSAQYPLPIDDIDEDKPISLYGAGKIGKAYKVQIDSLPQLKIATWVDANYMEHRESGLDVDPIETLWIIRMRKS